MNISHVIIQHAMWFRVLKLVGLMLIAASMGQTQTLHVELIEERTIGNNEEASSEYLFRGLVSRGRTGAFDAELLHPRVEGIGVEVEHEGRRRCSTRPSKRN